MRRNQLFKVALIGLLIALIPSVALAGEALSDANILVKEIDPKAVSKWTVEQALDPSLKTLWHQHLADLYREASKGDRSASAQIQYYKREGFGEARDYMDPVRMEYLAAVVGDPQALELMWLAQRDGLYGFEKDPQGALKHLERSCAMGYPAALCEMGIVHERGELVPRDLEKAEYYFRNGFAAGSLWAGVLLGDVLQEQGRFKEAVAIYLDAGEKGESFGYQRAAKVSRLRGNDPEEVIALYTKSANAGNPFGHQVLAQIYLGAFDQGQFDPDRAMDHMEIVLDRGGIEARKNLAQFIGGGGFEGESVDGDDPSKAEIHETLNPEKSALTASQRRTAMKSQDNSRASRLINELSRYSSAETK